MNFEFLVIDYQNYFKYYPFIYLNLYHPNHHHFIHYIHLNIDIIFLENQHLYVEYDMNFYIVFIVEIFVKIINWKN
jgi:hypothetical protein